MLHDYNSISMRKIIIRESCKKKKKHHWDKTFLHFATWAAWNLSSFSIGNRTIITMIFAYWILLRIKRRQ